MINISVAIDLNVFSNPLESDTDRSGQPDNLALIPKSYDMDGDGRINSLELIDYEGSYYLGDRMRSIIRNDPFLLRDESGNLIEDDDMDGDGIPDSIDPDRDNDGMPDLYEEQLGVANDGWQHPYVHNSRYVVLVAGGGRPGDRYGAMTPIIVNSNNYAASWNNLKKMHDILIFNYKYTKNNLLFFYKYWDSNRYFGEDPWTYFTIQDDHTYDTYSFNGKQYNYIDESPYPFNNVRSGIDNSIKNRISNNDFFVFIFAGHGYNGGMFFGRDVNWGDSTFSNSKVSYDTLYNWLADMPYYRSVIISQACYSGSIMSDLVQLDKSIIISASDASEKSYTNRFPDYLYDVTSQWAFLGESGKDAEFKGFVNSFSEYEINNNILKLYLAGSTSAYNANLRHNSLIKDDIHVDYKWFNVDYNELISSSNKGDTGYVASKTHF